MQNKIKTAITEKQNRYKKHSFYLKNDNRMISRSCFIYYMKAFERDVKMLEKLHHVDAKD